MKIKDVYDGYYVHDATLGFRLRPCSWVVCLEPDKDAQPQMVHDRRLAVDPFGFISQKNDLNHARPYRFLADDPQTFLILVSGGSTAAGWGASDNEHTWPSLLEKLLEHQANPIREKYKRIAVVNSGVCGYGIAQEIKRFQEETAYLKPKIVISLSGLNECWKYHGNPVDYATLRQQYDLTNPANEKRFNEKHDWLTKKLSRAINKPVADRQLSLEQTYGYRRTDYLRMSAEQIYRSKIRQFKSLCECHNAHFAFCLQPAMGYGHKTLTAEENTLIDRYYHSGYSHLTWDEYCQRLENFYQVSGSHLTENWQYDLTGVFDEVKERVYFDSRHYNNLGNELIAQWMFKQIIDSYPQRALQPNNTPAQDD